MKGLFQNIRSGIITKPACETQLRKFKFDKMHLTSTFLDNKIGKDLYTKKLAELNFCVEMMQSIVDRYEDLRLPLKTKPEAK